MQIRGPPKIGTFPRIFDRLRTRMCAAVMASIHVSLFCLTFTLILSGSITLATGTYNHNDA